MEFEKLSQGNKTVTKYASKFNALVRYVPWIANVPENKAQRFQVGLRPQLRERLAPFLIRDYASSIERARALELEIMRTEELRQVQEQFFPDPQESEAKEKKDKKAIIGKDKKEITGKEESSYKEMSTTLCQTCHKHHFGDCLKGSGKCFKCGQAGHRAWECEMIKCFSCGQVGHVSPNCPSKTQGVPVKGRPAQQRAPAIVNNPVRIQALTQVESQEMEEEVVTDMI